MDRLVRKLIRNSASHFIYLSRLYHRKVFLRISMSAQSSSFFECIMLGSRNVSFTLSLVVKEITFQCILFLYSSRMLF